MYSSVRNLNISTRNLRNSRKRPYLDGLISVRNLNISTRNLRNSRKRPAFDVRSSVRNLNVSTRNLPNSRKRPALDVHSSVRNLNISTRNLRNSRKRPFLPSNPFFLSFTLYVCIFFHHSAALSMRQVRRILGARNFISTDSDYCGFPRIPVQNLLKLRTSGASAEAVWSNGKRTQSSRSRSSLSKKYELLLRSIN